MPASYSLSIGDSLRAAWSIDGASTLVFSLTPTEAKPGPRQAAKDTTKRADSSSKKSAPKPRTLRPKKAEADTAPVDLHIEAVDAEGRVASVELSSYGVVRRPLESYVYRRAGRDKLRFASVYEIVLQTYAIPLADFARAAPGFDPARLTRLRWRFDKTEAGTVLLDNIGVSRLSPAFLAPADGRGGVR